MEGTSVSYSQKAYIVDIVMVVSPFIGTAVFPRPVLVHAIRDWSPARLVHNKAPQLYTLDC